MKLNIAKESEQEIYALIEALCEDVNFKREDEMAIVAKTPFVINPDCKRSDWINKTYLIMYPKLLSYSEKGEKLTPWICCRVELEGERPWKQEKQILDFFVEKLKSIGYTPFKDEDAFAQHWSESKRKGWTKFECFVNPDYTKGWWENHTL